MIRKHRTFILAGVAYFVLGFLGLILKDDFIHYYNAKPIFVTTISVALLLTGIGSILYVYLQGGFSNREMLERSEINRDYLRQFERLRNELTHKLNEDNKVPVDEKKLQSIIDAKIDKITNETLFNQIKSKYEDRLVADIKTQSLEDELISIKERIERDTARISRNSNINLTIGFFTTFMAIFFLGYSLLGVSHTSETTQSFIFHLVPRFTLSLFIELFSFFFLRIYKRNLEDIKYLNNERTNIDLKLISLRTAIVHNDTEALKSVIVELSKTERNFILKKDESTVDVEKSKLDKLSSDKLLESIVQIVNRK